MARELSSPLAPSIRAYVAHMRARGYDYTYGERELGRLDELACEVGWDSDRLGRELVEEFVRPRPGERPHTAELRCSAVRGFGRWLARGGAIAYVAPPQHGKQGSFTPVVMSEDEVRRLLEAADGMRPTAKSPTRHVVIPSMLRAVYACGLRVSEARLLRVGEVDLEGGVITVSADKAKFNKGRIVPLSDALSERLAGYDRSMGTRGPSAPFFPSPKGFWQTASVGRIFRALLCDAGISRTDDGPTLHSLRHSFACHRIMRWARAGEDVNALLPLLAAYLGHVGIRGTERYLRLTAEMMPDLREAVEEKLSWVIPGVS